MPTILIICTGNTCRSPMAAALLQAKADAALNGALDEADRFCFASAGTHALVGARAAQSSIDLLAQRGIDLRAHRARLLTLDMVRNAALLLVMEEAHRRAIMRRWPDLTPDVTPDVTSDVTSDVTPKLLLFGELAGDLQDIANPFGGGMATYAATMAQMDRLIVAMWQPLLVRVGLAPHR